MLEHNVLIESLIERMNTIIVDMEGQEGYEPDLVIAQELAEQLREELKTIQED